MRVASALLAAAAALFAALPAARAHFNPAGPGAHSSAVDWWLWQAEESVKVREGVCLRAFCSRLSRRAQPKKTASMS
jgi:hypothetical protein